MSNRTEQLNAIDLLVRIGNEDFTSIETEQFVTAIDELAEMNEQFGDYLENREDESYMPVALALSPILRAVDQKKLREVEDMSISGESNNRDKSSFGKLAAVAEQEKRALFSSKVQHLELSDNLLQHAEALLQGFTKNLDTLAEGLAEERTDRITLLQSGKATDKEIKKAKNQVKAVFQFHEEVSQAYMVFEKTRNTIEQYGHKKALGNERYITDGAIERID